MSRIMRFPLRGVQGRSFGMGRSASQPDVVIGAGVIGMYTAYSLAKRGRNVVVLDQAQGAATGSSLINGTLICPSLMLPWTGPQMIPKLLKSFVQRGHPLKVHPKVLAQPELYYFGLHYLASCRPGQDRLSTRRLANLASYSRNCMQELFQLHPELDAHMDRAALGTLQIFDSKDSAQACLEASREIQHAGVPLRMFAPEDGDVPKELVVRLKELGLEALYLYSPLDTNGDCHKFTTFLERECRKMGVGFRYGAQVEAFEQNAAWNVVLHGQPAILASNVILCAGIDSPRLAALLGLRLPMVPVKGYAITVPLKPGVSQLSSNVVQDSKKLYLAPVGRNLIRITGCAEFAGLDKSVDLNRASILTQQADKLLPNCLDFSKAEYHAGLRPLSADDVPIMGQCKPNFYLNTGHGSKGWTHAAGSGELIADLVTGTPQLDPASYSLDRFFQLRHRDAPYKFTLAAS